MKWFLLVSAFILLGAGSAWAGDGFTNALIRAERAANHGDVARAVAIYNSISPMETNNASNLCVLARSYCDLTCLTRSASYQKDLVNRALHCASLAEALDPTNATAHASVAVCYAKSCAWADVKTELEYSRLFRQEAEKAIALNPKEDIAYYLLGRWNYGIATLGFFSRAYVKVAYGALPKASLANAVAYFQKARDLAPGRILYHAGLAMAYHAQGRTNLEKAELKICRALKPLDPEDLKAQEDARSRLKNALGKTSNG